MKPLSRLRLKWPDIEPNKESEPQPPLFQRLLWLVAIWIASVLLLYGVARLIRLVLL
jgi:Protein of unknown function (DUF2474)